MSSTFSCHTVSMPKSVDTDLCAVEYLQAPVFLVQIDLEAVFIRHYIINGELDPLVEQVAITDDPASSLLSIPYDLAFAAPGSRTVRYLEQQLAVLLNLDPSSCEQVAFRIDASITDAFPLPSGIGGVFLKADVQVLHQDMVVVDYQQNAGVFKSGAAGSALQKVKVKVD